MGASLTGIICSRLRGSNHENCNRKSTSSKKTQEYFIKLQPFHYYLQSESPAISSISVFENTKSTGGI